MAKVQHVFESREQLDKAVAASEGKLKGFTVGGKFVAAGSQVTALWYALSGETEIVELGKSLTKAKSALDALTDEDRAVLIRQYVPATKGKK